MFTAGWKNIRSKTKELPNGKTIGEYYLISSEGKNYVRK